MDLALAISLATAAHAGQVDKLGQPYIHHPLRVMLLLRAFPQEWAVVGVLHDVLEDTFLTLDDLGRLGLNVDQRLALLALTRQKGETYADFIRRVGLPVGPRQQIALDVKIADLQDNLDPMRSPAHANDAWKQRQAKYQKALAFLVAVRDGDPRAELDL